MDLFVRGLIISRIVRHFAKAARTCGGTPGKELIVSIAPSASSPLERNIRQAKPNFQQLPLALLPSTVLLILTSHGFRADKLELPAMACHHPGQFVHLHEWPMVAPLAYARQDVVIVFVLLGNAHLHGLVRSVNPSSTRVRHVWVVLPLQPGPGHSRGVHVAGGGGPVRVMV